MFNKGGECVSGAPAASPQKAVPQNPWWLSWFLTYGHACGRASGFDIKVLLTRASVPLERMMCVCGCLPSKGAGRQVGEDLAVVLGPEGAPHQRWLAHLPDHQGLAVRWGPLGLSVFIKNSKKKKYQCRGMESSLMC